LRHLGFAERIRGSHHIFTRESVAEILNLQPKGSKAKASQVRQLRGLIAAYRLAGELEGESPPPAEPPTEAEPGEATTEKSNGGQHPV
jgi:hypothetical protein